MRRVTFFIVAITVVIASSSASAQSTPDFEREVLRSIDTVPTRAWLDATYDDARVRLETAARDASNSVHVRHRAITLLSLYPDTRTRAFLERLLEHDDDEIRRMAVYTLGRAYGTQADRRLVETIANTVARDEGVVAAWAVRSLRWVHHTDAQRLLGELQRGSDERLARLAALALRRSTFSASSVQ